jgi:Fe-S cluster biogenesis protein NfuA
MDEMQDIGKDRAPEGAKTPQTPEGAYSPQTPQGPQTPQTPQEAYSIETRVRAALEICRPFLEADRGGIELVRVTPDSIAELRFTGECVSCSLSKMTLRAGVERVVMRYAPEIRRVESVP